MGSGLYNTPEHIEQGKMMYAVTADDALNLCYGLNVNGGNRIWAIGSKTYYPELCMAIINWLATPEGVMTYNYGPLGVTWEYGDDGAPTFTELGLKTSSDNTTPMPAPYSGTFDDGSFKMNNTTWSLDASNPDASGTTFNKTFWPSTLASAPSDIMRDWQEKTGAQVADDYLEGNGHISIAIGTSFSFAPRSDEMNTIWTQVVTAVKDGSWKAIYAASDAEFDKIVSDMTAQAKAYGYDQCVAFTQEQAVLRKAAEDAAKAE
jgi:multiple sugar transport system substrate-binding protein/putative aldouronate transport system substrate-binding protein